MSRRSVDSSHSRWRMMGHTTGRINGNRLTENSVGLEQRFFEYDRRIVSGVLKTLRESIHEGAEQLGMMADERMFDDSLSANLSRTSRRLDRIYHTLESVLGEVAKATGYPDILVRAPVKPAEVRRLPERRE
jgi:hypothetical protein